MNSLLNSAAMEYSAERSAYMAECAEKYRRPDVVKRLGTQYCKERIAHYNEMCWWFVAISGYTYMGENI
jgi:hypothetical protein